MIVDCATHRGGQRVVAGRPDDLAEALSGARGCGASLGLYGRVKRAKWL